MKLSDIELSSQQKTIVFDTKGNIVVSASAGTGKTRTMIAKIIHDRLQNKTHKSIAAITFTIRAAQEIRDRLTVDPSRCFIGTNNSFAIEEIIKPFMKDVYGDDCDIDMDTDYSNTLLDFNSGVTGIMNHQTISSYKDNKKNFVFELALNIVERSQACRLYLQAKYFAVYIDEYQDCDEDMHNFFMHLSDVLGIITFIVGDDKQSIYRWRKANPEFFKSVFQKESFTHMELTDNHRSNKQIQDYSNLLFEGTRPLVIDPQNCNNIFWIMANNNDWASKAIGLIDTTKTSALLRLSKNNTKTGKQGASEGADLLTNNGIEHIYIPPTPIDDITTNAAWLYTAIACFVLLDTYSVYDLINDIPAQNIPAKSGGFTVRTKNMLNDIKKNVDDVDSVAFTRSVELLAKSLGYATTKLHINKLYETVKDDRYAVALNSEKPLHCALTIHSSKGLEFEQVILCVEDYSYFGNIEEKDINNHYVACTRAKSKLIIIDNGTPDAIAMKQVLEKVFLSKNISFNQLITML